MSSDRWNGLPALRATLIGAFVLGLAACATTVPELPSPTGAKPFASPTSTMPPTTTPFPGSPTPVSTPVPPTPGQDGTASGPTSPAAPVHGQNPSEPWRPPAVTTWQYQLSGPLDLSVDAALFVIDWEDTTPAQVSELHGRGRAAVCYVNAGAYEEWRGDAGRYPDAVLGEPLDGWPGERWLDIRNQDSLLPILAARLDVCKEKGFDAVDADNVDGYSNGSGFPLTSHDQLAFNRAVAQLAHDRGLSIGLKNNVEQVAELESTFDFAVNEECLQYDECGLYSPFLEAGKPVLHIEYEPLSVQSCAFAKRLGLSTIVKELELGPDLTVC